MNDSCDTTVEDLDSDRQGTIKPTQQDDWDY
jgi:hypothetical protein